MPDVFSWKAINTCGPGISMALSAAVKHGASYFFSQCIILEDIELGGIFQQHTSVTQRMRIL